MASLHVHGFLVALLYRRAVEFLGIARLMRRNEDRAMGHALMVFALCRTCPPLCTPCRLRVGVEMDALVLGGWTCLGWASIQGGRGKTLCDHEGWRRRRMERDQDDGTGQP